jgi:hypothetical protein
MNELRKRALALKSTPAVGMSEVTEIFIFPELAAALETQDDAELNKAILTIFLQDHDPARLGEVDALLREWKGREEQLFDELVRKYDAFTFEPIAVHSEMKKEAGGGEAKAGEEELPDQVADMRVTFVVEAPEGNNGAPGASGGSAGSSLARARKSATEAMRSPQFVVSGVRRPSGMFVVKEKSASIGGE